MRSAAAAIGRRTAVHHAVRDDVVRISVRLGADGAAVTETGTLRGRRLAVAHRHVPHLGFVCAAEHPARAVSVEDRVGGIVRRADQLDAALQEDLLVGDRAVDRRRAAEHVRAGREMNHVARIHRVYARAVVRVAAGIALAVVARAAGRDVVVGRADGKRGRGGAGERMQLMSKSRRSVVHPFTSKGFSRRIVA